MPPSHFLSFRSLVSLHLINNSTTPPTPTDPTFTVDSFLRNSEQSHKRQPAAMKISKNKSKGKVHPSPINPSSSSSCCSFSTCKDASSTLKLLPVTILTLISVLSPAEREVFAYMITRSIKATSSPSSLLEDSLIRSSTTARKSSSSLRKSSSSALPHVSPVFDCGCFDCYTSYWFRWDSSPNRELIHQAIEAFEEEHLSVVGDHQQKKSSSSSGGRGKTKKGRVSCCPGEYSTAATSGNREDAEMHREIVEVVSHSAELLPVKEAAANYPAVEKGVVGSEGDGLYVMQEKVEVEVKEVEIQKEEEEAEMVAGQRTAGGGGNHNKGLARKVLPDVIGLFNSRMWSLWSPNV